MARVPPVLRAARRAAPLPAPDPWLQASPARHLERGVNLTRRAGQLLILLLVAALAAGVLGLAVTLLGVGVLKGSALAGWLLLVTLLLGALGAVWTVRRAMHVLRPAPTAPLPEGPADLAQDEAALLRTLRAHERALPAGTLPVFQGAVIATRDALRLTAADTTLGRDTFDARQAARQDLPDLMDAYHAVPPGPQREQELLGQLNLIAQRMQRVIHTRAEAQGRALSAHGRYLQGKYRIGPDDPGDPESSA